MTRHRPHRLSRAQFDALAAGGGDHDVLAVLSSAQLSKRLLLLREVRFGSAVGYPGAADAWRLLDEAMARRPAAVRKVLGRPFVDSWATRALRGGEDDDTGHYLAGLAAAAGVAAGVPFELPLAGGAQTVLLPGFGQLGGLSPAPGALRYDGRVLSVDGGERPLGIPLAGATSVGLGGGGTSDGPGVEPDAEHWRPYRTVRWAEIEIELDDLDPHRSCFGLRPAARLDGPAADRTAALLRDALAMIDEELPRYRPTVRTCLRALVPVEAPAAGSVSASNQSAFGAIAVSPTGDAGELALLLVHEAQHAKLGALLDLVDLVDPDASGVYHAPWRSDSRPAGPLLQGVYAHAAVADFWRVRRRRLHGEHRRAAEFEYAYWRSQARRGADTLLGSPALTPVGRSFVETLAGTLDGWPDECHPDVRDAVAECATVTRVAWRLRNHDVPTPRVRPLVAAFRSGARCPPVPPPEVRADGPSGSAMASDLVRLIRQRAIDPGAPAPAGPDAVAAELVGEQAVAELDGRLRRDPDDADAWALLALALSRHGHEPAARAVHQRPELVRALVTELAGRARASTVAGWLFPALTT